MSVNTVGVCDERLLNLSMNFGFNRLGAGHFIGPKVTSFVGIKDQRMD